MTCENGQWKEKTKRGDIEQKFNHSGPRSAGFIFTKKVHICMNHSLIFRSNMMDFLMQKRNIYHLLYENTDDLWPSREVSDYLSVSYSEVIPAQTSWYKFSQKGM